MLNTVTKTVNEVFLSAPFVSGVNIVIDLVDPADEVGSRSLNKNTVVRLELADNPKEYIEIDTCLDLWKNYSAEFQNETQVAVDQANTVRDVIFAKSYYGMLKHPVTDAIQLAFWDMYGEPKGARTRKFVGLSGEKEQAWFYERLFTAINALLSDPNRDAVFF